MKKYILILIFALFSCINFAYAERSFDFNGYLKSEVSMRIDGDANTTLDKFKNFVDLSGQYKIQGDELVFFAHTRYWYDAAYDLNDKLDPAQHYMGHVQRTDWLRDCYLDYIHGPWFLRLGKQQVAWGQADGVAVLDRVNPVDLTEYWLPDVVDLRIPLWMVNINYSPKLNSNLQLLIIPDFEQSSAAPPGAPFVFKSYKDFMAFKTSWESRGNVLNIGLYYPAKQFENSKIGLQWQDRIADWDYTLNYLYGYDYLARTYLDSTVVGRPTILNYGRRFKLVQMVGGSINKSFTNPGPLQGITLRGDAAVYLNEPTYYGDTTSRGVNRWNNVFWLMGLDKYVVTNWLVSFQFAQYIMEHDSPGVGNYKTLNTYTYGPQDAVENIFSLKISTDFMHERLKPEILWSWTDDNQGRISPKVTYEINDNLWLTLGLHYFYGKEFDSNGQFRHQNQLYTQLKYTF